MLICQLYVNTLERGVLEIQISNYLMCDKQRKTKQSTHKDHPDLKVEKDNRTGDPMVRVFVHLFSSSS